MGIGEIVEKGVKEKNRKPEAVRVLPQKKFTLACPAGDFTQTTLVVF